MSAGPHDSHVLRGSDASSFDHVCERCGRTDKVPGGWGELAEPCPSVMPKLTRAQAELEATHLVCTKCGSRVANIPGAMNYRVCDGHLMDPPDRACNFIPAGRAWKPADPSPGGKP